MQLLIDADGCPVVDLAVRAARQRGIPCVILCDSAHEFHKDGAVTVTVSKGADSADFALVNRVAPGDIVVTQDYGLAAMALARGARVINQDGMRYDDGNIDALLLQRHTAARIRRGGGRLHGNAKRKDEQDRAFAAGIEELLNE
jgi:uncharacterized protein YaiI (UPF0178 family)